ncbi:MAG: PaaI family thioesterase [Rhodospirillaceae bacterium]|jgi:1,4-dihydroxy-2-naphthoyl-CoA hydrolase|nr:PaaI family thioesterase [Rhodospirillaceae bacterium]MBT5192739.1 PaaI family thioesterase [Rhodospirillaceae bacterium]MBT5898598.1 PaaI family thioesterase [Rhodospirillaceae bacterium]MBT6426396.1 PaaI family thioesterase [Rhodospirillaceae bacterium]MBT7756711.1 PaaI family thioesterase [Rhodospirillaceae bacterium]
MNDVVIDQALTAAMRERMPLVATLEMEFISAAPEGVTARMAWAPERCTANGILHGGAIMAFADTLGGFLAFFNLPEGAAATTTIESKTNFFRAIRGGYLYAQATPLHTGRSTIVIDTELTDDAGKRVARVTQTQAVLGG